MAVGIAGKWVLIPRLDARGDGHVKGMTTTMREQTLTRPVRVFENDRDLLDGLTPREAAIAWHVGVADSTIVPEGPWTPPGQDAMGRGALGLLVLNGLVTRSIGFDGRQTPELLGAGDLLRPWESDAAAGFVEPEASWRIMERATVALLDECFAERVRRVPGLHASLLGRAVQRSRWWALHSAVTQIRRAEPRVLLLLWHLADRWGRVTPHGVHLPLPLTHAFLARLACMRRPTVSAALAVLARAGELERRSDRTWMLTGAPPDIGMLRDGAARGLRSCAEAA